VSTAEIIKLLLELAPAIGEATMKVLQNQTQILNDIHSLLKKQGEDLAVLLKRTEK
jgi:hypothetical protein